jgi:hypothetical protein
MRTIKQGKSLTIILSDGIVITDTNVSKETEDFIKENSEKEEEIKKYFMLDVEEKEEVAETRALVKDIVKSSIFKYDDVTGITTIPSVSEVSVPKHLIDKIKQVEGTDAVESYLNFWRLACRNPNEHSRENLLWFLQTHDFTILKSGLFVAYRNVVKVKNKTISVEDLYKNIKQVQKKSPKKFKVIKTPQNELKTKKLDYVVKNGEVEMGNLEDLNKQTETADSFTDKYTGKFQIKLGQPVTMSREKCDSNPNNSCSTGLHVACKDWSGLKQFGDTSIAVLVNPIDVVAVPKDSGYSKMRVCQYFPVKVVQWENNKIVEDIKEGDSLDFWEAIIEGEVNNTDSNPHKIKVPDMPVKDYNKYILNVKQIRDQLKNKMIK